MAFSDLPTADQLGTDPEPLGVRAERLLDTPPRPRRAPASVVVTGNVRGRIIIVRLREASYPRPTAGAAS